MAILTNQKMRALRDAALADPTASVFMADGQDIPLAAWFNAPTVTLAWRDNMPWRDFFEAMDGAEYQSRSPGERDYIRELRESGPINASRNKIRSSIQAAFNGVATRTVSCRNSIWGAATEFATKAETILGGTMATEDSVAALRRAVVLSSNGVGNISYALASEIRVS